MTADRRGRFTFFDYGNTPAVNSLIARPSLSVSVSRNSFASARAFTSATHFTGCIYGEDKQIVPMSQRPSIAAWYKPSDPETVEIASRGGALQAGSTLYLGILHKHFGHFILESVSRLWLSLSFDVPFDAYYFHPWQDKATLEDILAQEFVRICLDCFQIPIDRVKLVPGDGVRFENCVIPEQLFHINSHAHELFGLVVDRITSASQRPDRLPPILARERLYFSRIFQDRRAVNEAMIEDIFRQNSFSIVYPETLSFLEQLEMMRHAKMIAGCDGSAMHLALFAKSATIICIDQRNIRNQLIIEELRGHSSYHIWAMKEQIAPNRWMADIAAIRKAVDAIMNGGEAGLSFRR